MNITMLDVKFALELSHYDIENLRILAYVSSFLYEHMIYFIGIPQVLLNIGVILVLISCSNGQYRGANSQYVFAFILNLATVDLCGFVVMVCAVLFNRRAYTDDYYEGDATDFSDRINITCRIQMAIWSFSYVSSLISSVILTLERYWFMTRPFSYHKIVNNISIGIFIALAWIIPIVFGVVQATKNPTHKLTMCNPSHADTSTLIKSASVAMIFLAVVLALNIMYGRILVQSWQVKRRTSIRRRKMTTTDIYLPTDQVFGSKHFYSLFEQPQGEPVILSITNLETNMTTSSCQQTQESKPSSMSPLFNNLARIGKFTAAAKYVILICLTFTLCWLPWIVVFFGDTLYHLSGNYNDVVTGHCDSFQKLSGLSHTEEVSLQLCVHGYILESGDFSHRKNCNVPWKLGWDVDSLCAEIYFHAHNLIMKSFVELSIVVAVANSLFNPIIYALSSTEFRAVAFRAVNKVHKKFFSTTLI